MEEKKVVTIEEYIASCDEGIQTKLTTLYQLIKSLAPELKEKISWGMPTFYKNHNIIHFAANKNHIGLYPGSEAIEFFADRLEAYQTSKGAIKIPNNMDFDKELIRDIIIFNLQRD